MNLQQVNHAFDKTSEQGSFDHGQPLPSDSSNNSYTRGSLNDSYIYYQSHSDSAGTSDSEYGHHTLSSSTEHSRKSIRYVGPLVSCSVRVHFSE